MNLKTYYCLSRDSRRIVVQAASKKQAAESTGIAADLWVLCHDPKLIAAASATAQIEN